MELLDIFHTDFLHTILQDIVEPHKIPHVIHVGSRDSWPTQLYSGQHAAMIFNTDLATQSGQHWIAAYVDGVDAYVFDSLPVEPFPDRVLQKLSKICKNVYNANPDAIFFQDSRFPLCGIYSLSFLKSCINKTPLKLCDNFPLANDATVLLDVYPYIHVYL